MEMNFASYKEKCLAQSRAKGPGFKKSGPDSNDKAKAWDKRRLDEESALVLKNIFFYLSIIFRYPTEKIYSEIQSNLDVFADFFADYGGTVPELPPIADLQSEYISLFVNNQGFVPAAPYASCYQGDGLLMNDNFHRLRQIMVESGFMLDETVHELEDHLAVLLEFCSSLLNTLVEKKNSSNKNLMTCLDALLEVTYSYIHPIVDDFNDKIDTYANYDFYKITGKALKSLFHNADTMYVQLLGFRQNSIDGIQG